MVGFLVSICNKQGLKWTAPKFDDIKCRRYSNDDIWWYVVGNLVLSCDTRGLNWHWLVIILASDHVSGGWSVTHQPLPPVPGHQRSPCQANNINKQFSMPNIQRITLYNILSKYPTLTWYNVLITAYTYFWILQLFKWKV